MENPKNPLASRDRQVFWSSEGHRVLTQLGFQLSGIPDRFVGKAKTIGPPYGQDPRFSTQIRDGDAISTILKEHCNDPDSYSIVPKWQEEHAAVIPSKIGLAPYMAQSFVNDGLNTKDEGMQYLYLAWALHYLEDCGNPLHTTFDPNIQKHHFAYEKFVDDNITSWIPELETATVKTVKNLFMDGWKLAEFSNPYAPIIAQAYETEVPDIAILTDVSKTVLKETLGYVAGAIQNFGDLYYEVAQPISLFTVSVISLPFIGLGLAYVKGRK